MKPTLVIVMFIQGVILLGMLCPLASAATNLVPYSQQFDNADTTPPFAVTSISKTSTCHRINWTLAYTSYDVTKVMVWTDNTYNQNITFPDTTIVIHNVTPGSSHTVSTKTVDAAGNVNNTWKNSTDSSDATCIAWPKIMHVFDDGHISSYTTVAPILDQFGYSATSFIIVGSTNTGIDNAYFMNVSSVTSLYNKGWDISNHGFRHVDMTKLTPAEQIANVEGGQKNLRGWGFSRSAEFFAIPFGTYNAEVLSSIASAGTLASRSSDIGHTIIPINSLMNIKSTIIVLNRTTVASVKTQTAAGTTNEIIITMFHVISDADPTNDYTWSPANYAELANWYYDEGYELITFSQFYVLNSETVPVTPAPKVSTVNSATSLADAIVNPHILLAALALLVFVLIVLRFYGES